MPCPERGCNKLTTRRRWNSGGPRIIHDVDSGVYLNYCEYDCTDESHPSFKGINAQSMAKLPMDVQDAFGYQLTEESGVTDTLMAMIMDARPSASSLSALERRISEAKHERMYRHQRAYYRACTKHKLYTDMCSNGKAEQPF